MAPGLIVLWLFLAWYLTMVMMHFEASSRLWLNSLAMSIIIGTALTLSVRQAGEPLKFWVVFRLHAIPFCVSSFSALVRDDGFYAIFAPAPRPNLIALAVCTALAALILTARGLVGEEEACQAKK
ncbi:MAG: hypothetical protein ACPGJE_08190 [Wenzhouxiangellaceae bacterium]